MTYHKHHRGPVYDAVPDYVITTQPRRRRRGTLSPYGWLWLTAAVIYVSFVWIVFDFIGDVSVPGEISVEWVR